MIAPREARPTVKFVDEYCASYRKLFPEVRSFEAFQQLHVGMVSEIKRKTLPEIAEVVGLNKFPVVASLFDGIAVGSRSNQRTETPTNPEEFAGKKAPANY